MAGRFEVSGKFDFAGDSRLASFLGAHVPVIDPDRERWLGTNGKPMTCTMFFPKSAAQVRDTWQVMGLRGTGSDSYTLTRLFVLGAYSLPRYTARQPRVSGNCTFSHRAHFTPRVSPESHSALRVP